MNSDFSSLTELFSTNEKQLKKEKEQIQKEEYLKKNIKQKSTTQNKKDIWEDEEIVAAEEAEELNDPRSQPEYDIAYRQTVSSEDMFLGMSGKLNSISHSDFLVVTIKLPGVKFKEVQLDCTEFKIDLRCPIYKLNLSLPKKVDEKKGDAKWDSVKSILKITLPVINEF